MQLSAALVTLRGPALLDLGVLASAMEQAYAPALAARAAPTLYPHTPVLVAPTSVPLQRLASTLPESPSEAGPIIWTLAFQSLPSWVQWIFPAHWQPKMSSSRGPLHCAALAAATVATTGHWATRSPVQLAAAGLSAVFPTLELTASGTRVLAAAAVRVLVPSLVPLEQLPPELWGLGELQTPPQALDSPSVFLRWLGHHLAVPPTALDWWLRLSVQINVAGNSVVYGVLPPVWRLLRALVSRPPQAHHGLHLTGLGLPGLRTQTHVTLTHQHRHEPSGGGGPSSGRYY